MSGSDEQNVECPLCMEPLEMDDINFYPCTCGYQICRFCWHRIRTDENGLCPACRKQYPEDPADFKPLSAEELQRIKSEKKQKDQQRKQKLSENRKHLVNVRVVQKNLVFVVGLSQRLADPEVLKKQEYFGKFGKIHKVVINHSTSYAGSQGPSASAYVTYHRSEDALRAIQAVNNIVVDGRTLKASLGTTKYCSHFLKGQQCPKSDCMYLHDLGDEAASFTKEEMQQGKHQEYERKLHEQLFTSYQPQPSSKDQTSRKQAASPTANQQQPNTNSKEGWPSLQSGSPNGSSFTNHISNWQGLDSPGNGEGNSKGPSPSGMSKQQDPSNSNRVPVANHTNHYQYTTSNNDSSGSNLRLGSAEEQRSGRTKENSESNSSWGSSNMFNQSSAPLTMSSTNQQQPSPSSSTSSLSSSPPSTGPKQPPNLQDSSFLTDELIYRPGTGSHLNLDTIRHINNYHRPRVQALKNSFDQSSDNSFFSGSNSFATTNGKLESPTNSSANSEWLNSTADPSPLITSESLPVSSSTDWQAAFGFASSQNNRDDDLGFDPWDESAKALADMIEKENQSHQPMLNSHMMPNHSHPCRYGPQHSQQQQLLLMENQHANAQARHLVNPPKYSISEMNGGGMHGYPIMDGSNHMGMPQSSRRLGAPPGFMPNQVNYNLSVNRPPSLTDLSRSNKVLPGGNVNQAPHYSNGSSHYYAESILNNLGYNNHLKDSGINHKSQDSFSMKEWQDNLRALLPNINVSFGGSQNFSQQSSVPHAQQNTGWNNYSPDISWMAEDPAILTAGNTTDNQTDSSPHWLKSLQQLAEEPPVVHNNHRVPFPSQYYRSPSWHSVSQTPPPGFAAPLRHTHRHSESQKLVENL